MATYNINCPHCGGTLEVQDEWAGMETTCPLCSNAFVIPRRETSPFGQGRRATPPSLPPPVRRAMPATSPQNRPETWAENSVQPQTDTKVRKKSSALFIIVGIVIIIILLKLTEHFLAL